ncbi:hypothetical protein E1956_08350 [Paraburkholderia pallida]|uniref:Uncharacterized protein n=1 Tax=Paraburkholderia pallida TaxID=2547399 RepID=A0A4P7CTL9_9BURK|nr:hypothetical protein E1956_08350 [Paraburkholderia pallida]
MKSDRLFRRAGSGWRRHAVLAGSVMALALASAGAHASGQPLILDTQRGISDGQSGTVLQNAPLSPEPMVQMKSLPTLNGTGTDGSQVPIIVEPYVQVPGGGGRPPRPSPQPLQHSAPPQ